MNKNKQRPTAVTEPTSSAGRKLARELWYGTAARYTVIALVLLLINVILDAASGTGNPANSMSAVTVVDTLRFFLLLPFSFLLAAAALIRRNDKLSTGARVLLHPLFTLGGFYLCFYLPYQIQTKPSPAQALLILLAVLILYIIVMTVYLLLTRHRRQKAVDATPYTRQFGSK